MCADSEASSAGHHRLWDLDPAWGAEMVERKRRFIAQLRAEKGQEDAPITPNEEQGVE